MVQDAVVRDHEERHWELHQAAKDGDEERPLNAVGDDRDLQAVTSECDLGHDLHKDGREDA